MKESEIAGGLRELADRIDRHGLGFEGWEDSPAHGWAEELRGLARQMREVPADNRVCPPFPEEWRWQLEDARAYRELEGELDRLLDGIGASAADHETADSEYWEDQIAALRDVLRRRLMPEGMSWPRFEDGEPVRLGSEWVGPDGDSQMVENITFGRLGFSLLGHVTPGYWFFPGRPIKRSVPIAHDGKPVRKGDTVYGRSDGKAWRVIGFDWGKPDYPVHAVGEHGDVRDLKPKWLTHERPATKDTKDAIKDGGPNPSSDVLGDSWDKLERDMELFGRYYAGTDPDENDCERDALVRRAKKLAGVAG